MAASRARAGVTSDSGESKLAAMNRLNSRLVELGQPGPQPPVAVRLGGPGETGHGGGHGLGVGVHVECAAVGEGGPVGRVEPDQVEPSGQLLADRSQGICHHVWHGQHGGAGVHPVAADVQAASPAARGRVALDDRDLAAAAGQVQRGGQPGQPGAHHHDVAGRPVTVRIVTRPGPCTDGQVVQGCRGRNRAARCRPAAAGSGSPARRSSARSGLGAPVSAMS